MRSKKLYSSLAAGALVALALTGCTATATTNSAATTAISYPTRPIQLVVPFGAGGGTDLVSRAAAAYLGKKWGETINVVDKPGAGGATGTESVLTAAPDGYTVLADNGSSTEALLSGANKPPFTLSNLHLVGTIVNEPFVFLVKSGQFSTMKQLDTWVKANPGKLSFGTTGVNSAQTYIVIQWLKSIGVTYSQVHLVPNNGASDLFPQLAGGHVVLGVQDATGASPMVKSGQVTALAVTSTVQSPLFPKVPTLAQAGVNGVTSSFWSGISLPSGVPQSIVQKWGSGMASMLKDPTFLAKLKTLNAQGGYLDSAQFTALVKSNLSTYTTIVKQNHLG
jgi:tripartite-type tricarboxylate transporter receptor subunit TctC